jgi:hypothetical protein
MRPRSSRSTKSHTIAFRALAARLFFSFDAQRVCAGTVIVSRPSHATRFGPRRPRHARFGFRRFATEGLSRFLRLRPPEVDERAGFHCIRIAEAFEHVVYFREQRAIEVGTPPRDRALKT